MLDLSMCRFTGPAFPEPFVRFELDKELKDLLPKNTGDAGREWSALWDSYRRHLRELVSQGGPIRVRNAVIEPLVKRLGYDRLEGAPDVITREGAEDGGNLLLNGDGRLRFWTTAMAEDLDAPSRRGRAFRFSHLRIAQRVLLATNERLGLLTNGVELRILISDPARTDSQIEIPIESHWKRTRDLPDSFRLVLAFCSSAGIKVLPDLIEKARLKQTGITKELRKQAREAVELFVQDLLGNPENHTLLGEYCDKGDLAKKLWYEGLINIFRLLFILKMESVDDPARAFSFASSTLWRNTFSPSVALASVARTLLDHGIQTGNFLEHGLRSLYQMFTDGLSCTEINVKPLGGALFGENTTPLISKLHWGELAVAHLLDRLLWTPRQRGSGARERVHYGPLTVGDLGRVYESLIELEPGITTRIMCRLRRRKLEVVVPVEQGKKYRPKDLPATEKEGLSETNEETDEESDEEEEAGHGRKTKIEWIEEIPADRFYLRVGLGRKASGSYYTPDSFVKFLVQETLGPLSEERSPKNDPQPSRVLELKVADIAMGSGHFLFEACEFLGEKLYEACRLCDELAMSEEARAEKTKIEDEKKVHLNKADEYRQRVQRLPDPNDELMAYLPSRAPEDGLTAYSVSKAKALCKRLVAVHCLYGVDLNPLAVELAKLSLWIETHAEGLPLTFLDHRFVEGDSITGPFFEHLLKYPGTQQPMNDLFTQGLKEKFTAALKAGLREVKELEATVGINIGEIESKRAAKARMDELLKPFRLVAAAWAGGVMLGSTDCDDPGYAALIKVVAEGGDGYGLIEVTPRLQKMIERGKRAIPFELVFPEAFFQAGDSNQTSGFDVVLGNPPWDAIQFKSKEFFAAFDFEILNAASKQALRDIEERLNADPVCGPLFKAYKESFEEQKRANELLYTHQKVFIHGDLCGRQLDAFRVFMERNTQLISPSGSTGIVVPSAFHANEGATGIRRLYLQNLTLRCCYSFENRYKLFDIHRSFKFDLIVASKPGPTKDFPCGFYLHNDGWLFVDDPQRPSLLYSRTFVERAGGPYLAFLEIILPEDAQIAELVAFSGLLVDNFMRESNISFSREYDAGGSQPFINRDGIGLPIIEGKCFHQFTDRWEVPQAFVDLHEFGIPPEIWRYYRLSFRRVARSTDERTSIWAILPAWTVGSDGNPIEQTPQKRPTIRVLLLLGIANSFLFDYQLRQRVSANASPFLVEICGLPNLSQRIEIFIGHLSVRLTCNHSGYAKLWNEQFTDEWREPKPKDSWPVLEGEDERWAMRAAIDAVVAEAYGLHREQYAHVLSTFSHKSYPKAPELCLRCFDELKSIGLIAFTKKHDPYWDIPLNENLPKPVIELKKMDLEGDSVSNAGDLKAMPLFQKRKLTQKSGEEEAVNLQVQERKSEADEEMYELIKLLLEDKRIITSADAQALTGFGPAQVRPFLQRLVDEGIAIRDGQRRGVNYRLIGKRE